MDSLLSVVEILLGFLGGLADWWQGRLLRALDTLFRARLCLQFAHVAFHSKKLKQRACL